MGSVGEKGERPYQPLFGQYNFSERFYRTHYNKPLAKVERLGPG